MGNRIRLVVGALGLFVVVSMGLVGASSPVAAAGSYPHFYKGKTARAQYVSSEQSTCTSTSVTVTASESMTRDASRSDGWVPSISVVLSRITGCTEQTKIWAYGYRLLNAGDFFFAGNTAYVKTQFELTDLYTGSPLPVDIDLTWTAVGEPHPVTESSVEQYPGYTLVRRSVETKVDALVSGTVFDGTMNWTPVSSNWVKNFLATATEGFVAISH